MISHQEGIKTREQSRKKRTQEQWASGENKATEPAQGLGKQSFCHPQAW
jgi:hypothetical protein